MILNLFFNFLRIGFFSIGGGYAVIPLIQECVVNEKRWLTAREFTDIITISQMTPGPLTVNTSTFVGIRVAGIFGAAAATIGCVISGFFLSILLCKFFDRYKHSAALFEVLHGLKAASLGLIFSAGGTLLLLALCGSQSLHPAEWKFNLKAAGLFLLSFAVLRKWRLNPILVMIASGAGGLLLYL